MATRMERRLVAVATLCVLAAPFVLSAPASAQTPVPEVTDRLRAYSIVPPGQEGNVTAAELLSGDYGSHYDDQLDMYADLVDDDDITGDELSTFFHPMRFGPEGSVEREYSPQPGSMVFRDSFGIPHIYADSMDDASFALGYVSAEDRLWQMDVFRHAARGTLSELIGPGENDQYFEMDVATRREGYTEAEAQGMLDRLDDKFGADGAAVQQGLESYAAGINEYIERLKTDPAYLDERPAEYEATGNPFPVHPEEWTATDTVYVVVLQLRVFGETAGGELQNAALYKHLRNRLGSTLGSKVFHDFVFQNARSSPTTLTRGQGSFPSQDLGRVKRGSFAIPDNAGDVARAVTIAESSRRGILADMGFKAPASNALIVHPEESASGNGLQIGAPQVGYAAPSFFMDIDVHAPGVDFRGPAVPGASALVPLGRGRDYAWSLTTGYSDAVDVRAERLCDPSGEVGMDSTHYMFRGECLAMSSRQETFVVKPTPTDPGPPRVEQRTFYRTRHGPVFARSTVAGKPVAFVKQRFFWKKELDSVPAFYRWNTQVSSVEDFAAAAKDFTMSFNAFYVDNDDIGYFHVGRYPRRTRGVHPALPVWGGGRWEWRGRFPYERHPKAINPAVGWAANWNNKPAEGWNNLDGLKWGPVQRVSLLRSKMRSLLRGDRKARLSDLVDVIRKAATQDVRGVRLGPALVASVLKRTEPGRERRGVLRVSRWIAQGAHRTNVDRDEYMDRGPAIALFDRWYTKLIHKIFDDELGPGGYRWVAAPIFDHDMWFDYSSYARTLFSRSAGAPLSRNYCDRMSTGVREGCDDVALSALRSSIEALTRKQGRDMSRWTAPAEWIEFQEFGAGSVERIPWQNRGTHNHVIEVLPE